MVCKAHTPDHARYPGREEPIWEVLLEQDDSDGSDSELMRREESTMYKYRAKKEMHRGQLEVT